MTAPTIEGFSVTSASILDGTTGAEAARIFGVRSGSLDIDQSQYDNTGDDQILSTWTWFNFATLTIESGFIPFPTLALITGGTITSSGVGPNDYWNIPLWNINSQNQPTRPVLIRVPSKDSLGNPRAMDFVIYRCQFEPIKFTGPRYKDGLVCTYTGRCLISSLDERGQALPEKAIGRIVSRPRNG
jgi:hypothetical protein